MNKNIEGMELLIDQMKETIVILKAQNKILSDEKYRLFDEVTALKAQNEILKDAGNEVYAELYQWALTEKHKETIKVFELWLKARRESPHQCLAEIKAQAVEDFCASIEALAIGKCPSEDECSADMVVGWKAGNVDCRFAGRKYAESIRKGGE